MKKFILLPLLALVIASCSTDDVMVQEDNATVTAAISHGADDVSSKAFGNFKD